MEGLVEVVQQGGCKGDRPIIQMFNEAARRSSASDARPGPPSRVDTRCIETGFLSLRLTLRRRTGVGNYGEEVHDRGDARAWHSSRGPRRLNNAPETFSRNDN